MGVYNIILWRLYSKLEQEFSDEANKQMQNLLAKTRNKIIFVIVVMLILPSLAWSFISHSSSGNLADWVAALMLNFSTEMIGIVVILLLVESKLDKIRELITHKEEGEKRKQHLISRIRNSKDNTTSLEALRELNELGALADGSLRNQKLDGTHLSKAQLVEADLSGANLSGADLQYSSLWYANLQNTILGSAKLSYANLSGADLSGADLRKANIAGAIIDIKTKFNEKTILPDGNNWSVETDMSKFINHIWVM